jgi:hypothetical protein
LTSILIKRRIFMERQQLYKCTEKRACDALNAAMCKPKSELRRELRRELRSEASGVRPQEPGLRSDQAS